jgi:hypothetical protein
MTVAVATGAAPECAASDDAVTIAFLTSDDELVLLLVDQDGTVTTGNVLPLVLDLAEFEVASPTSICATDGVTNFINLMSVSVLFEQMTDARTMGADTFVDLALPGAARLRTPAAMERSILPAVSALHTAGCTIDGHFGGAHDATVLDGEDQDGRVTSASIDRATRSWDTTFSDGTTTVTGGFNNNFQLFGTDGANRFALGRFVRTRGAIGTTYGVTGMCPAPFDYQATIGGWYRGPLPTDD